MPATKKLDNPTWATMVYLKLVPARTSPLSPYTNVVLRRGSTGPAVKALQKALGKLVVDGSYGPATEGRVKEFEKSKGLTVNGVTDSKVWMALIGASICANRSITLRAPNSGAHAAHVAPRLAVARNATTVSGMFGR